jgi:hypothetical protein
MRALAGLFIHTGWKKPYFFQIGQVLVVKLRARMFLIFADFFFTWGGGGLEGGMAIVTTRFRQGKQGMACRYRMAVG